MGDSLIEIAFSLLILRRQATPRHARSARSHPIRVSVHVTDSSCEAAYDARRRMKHWTRKIGLEYSQPSQRHSRLICPSTTKHLRAQARWLVECGCNGIVALGSLGEAPALTREEKVELLKQARRSLDGKAPVIAGISALSTAEAVWLAKEAHRAGVDGLMVLPPLVYRGDWRETRAHLGAIFQATPLSAMLYNNPVAYGTDILPEQIIELRAQHQNFHAVKESSGDIRRITSLKHLAGTRWRSSWAWTMWWLRV